MDNADCHFCNNYREDIDRLFKYCELTRQIWNTIFNYCPNPNNSDMKFIDWIEFIHKNEKVYEYFSDTFRKFFWYHFGNMDT